MSRSHGLEPRMLAACLLLASVASAQFGKIQRDQKISSIHGSFTGPLGNDYRFGVSVAEVDDLDGDGTRDLAVGSHRANLGGAERGAVWLLYMRPDGTVREYRQISSVAGGLTGPLDDRDRFGISLCSLGDLDLDGTTDLAVGAYRDDDGGMDCGCVYILFMTPQGTVKAEQKISALAGGFTGSLRVEDSFGWSVENIGDLDGDGVVDLAVGATRDDGDETDLTHDFGALYVLFLNADGTVKAHTRIAAHGTGFGAVLRPRDRFGSDVVDIEDADGDGVDDLAVGAFGEDPLKYGRVFVLHMNADGTVKNSQEIGFNTGGFTGLLGKGDRFGISLAADDLDGDGLFDLVIGAAGDDDGGAEAGAVWVCLLDPVGRVRSFEKISNDFGGFGGLLHPGDNFGISCATLGDLDRDGAVDLAVGSYQDDDGGFDRGATWVLFRSGTGAPVADFASAPTAGEIPLDVSFADRSSGAITSRSWDFGDGTGASDANPSHVYTVPGVYDVTLTVHGRLGSDSFRRQRAAVALVPVFPAADFAATPLSGPAPLVVAFSDLSTGSIDTWSWDFGDGTSSSLRFPKHAYDAAGTYSVSLTVTGSPGTNNKTVVDLIQVLPPPPTPDFAADPLTGLRPLTVTFTNLSSADATSWDWDFGDGTTASEREPLHVYDLAGTFAVTLTVHGPTGSQSLTRPALVSVAEPLTAVFDFVSPGGVAPVTVQFFDRSFGGATSWSWDFADGATSTLRNPTHRFDGGGTFPVTLTVHGLGQVDDVIVPVEIGEPRPDARFSFSAVSGNVPLRVSFTDESVGNITSWLWDFGDGSPYSTESSPIHGYRQPGTFTVRLRVTSAGGVDGLVRRDLIHVTSTLAQILGLKSPSSIASGPVRSVPK